MKRLFTAFIVQLIAGGIIGQSDNPSGGMLLVASNKTTSIVFPQVILSVDRGSKDIWVQKVSGAENILQLKAARDHFSETNMTVITADGTLYGFTVCYAERPPQLTIRLDSNGSVYEQVRGQKKFIHGIKDEQYGMAMRLSGIFIRQDIMYFQFELENVSPLSYRVDMLRFYTGDKMQRRRTAVQEIDQPPLYVYQRPVHIPGQSRQVIVAAFPRFTVPGKQLFYVQLTEENGGRNLRLKIPNRKIVRARTL